MVQTRKLFGTDGVRGKANVLPMTPEMALRLGRAITHVARRDGRKSPRVIIGKDTRLSCYMFEQAIAAGICAQGGRVMLSGPIPTPAVANLTSSMRADAGIVISASHNPFEDNGIKIFGRDGFKLPDAQELELEALLESDTIDHGPTGAAIGSAVRLDDAQGRYIVYAKSTFPHDLTLNGMKIVVDAANGAAYKVAPSIFAELGAEVIALGIQPNGTNINKRCGALHPEAMQREVIKRKADLGICLDGDADRVILVDEQGDIVDGDAVMALCATHLLQEKRLKKKTLVSTVMSNMGLEVAMKRAGGKLLRTGVGDRYVVEAMRKHKLNLGGEQSGHLVFLEHATTGDGCVAALQILAIMAREHRPMSELAQVMEPIPQVLISSTFSQRLPLDEMPRLNKEIKAAEAKLKGDGRVLVRWSGTEPKLRLMAEGPDPKKLTTWLNRMSAAAEKDIQAEKGRSAKSKS
ncbi:MAG: phosphoglucosamine mutase [Polyangiaceae bacterium]|nr:phosphoglucosamine mutase [Polyangiaceae bacterium]